LIRPLHQLPPTLRAKRSPCVAVCRMEPDTGLCAGCLRTIDEIASWGAMPEGERVKVWQQIDARRAARGAQTGDCA
jgi:predicted Fe-S protein YdhL (DUF1289 family)